MIGLGFGVFLAFIDMTIVATALPEIGSQLEAFDEITWVASSYMLTATALQPLYGKFSDIFGRVPVILFALVVFLVGCAICGAAQNIMTLIIARGLAGIGGAGLVSLCMIIISDIVPLNKRALFLGAFGGVFAIASIAGPLLGGAFTDYVSWRWVFYINLPIGAVTLIVIILFLRIPHKSGSILAKLRKIDYLGTFLLVGGIVFILLAILWGGKDYPWDDKRIIAFFCIGFGLIIAFVLSEVYFASEPIIPMELFRFRNVCICYTSVFFLGIGIMGAIFYLPIYFNVVRNDSATMAGVKLLPFMLSMVFGNVVSGVIIQKTGRCREIVWVGSSIATVGVGLLTTLSRASNAGNEVGYLLIFGFGSGLFFQTMLMICQSTAEESEVAVVTACYNFFQTIGATLGLAILSAIMNNVLNTRLPLIEGLDLAALAAAPSSINTMDVSEEARIQFIDAYVKAISTAFIPIIPMMGVIFLMSLGIKHVPLRKTLTGGAHG
ncbi:major facilitator superfamily domain-containing protein [Dimargaris cristalligena]|uniref:Major facilitator superfamily domain-containing protein n=1 Tax=Dimargaris cristalligena TaxID=215637 RepID=A0A4P9ZPI2_9FUNG|nr:major facilitator superfamily domain-containing protein [Dimargaris cristalligena]|eukprot:RKP34581.1 major facilitator superfamily domain-containing protein [Dimargaris cristalligena]